MPENDPSTPNSFKLGNYLRITYRGKGTFVEILNEDTGEYLWCDPWITDEYPLAKDTEKKREIAEYLGDREAESKLKGIFVTHTHGDHYGDVPEIMAQLCRGAHPPRVYGDANVQSLLCQRFAVDDTYRGHYGFYQRYSFDDFTVRELSRLGNPENRSDRKDFGIAFDIEKLPSSFSAPVIARQSHENYSFLMVTPIRWKHSKNPTVVLGANQALNRQPDLRTEYVSDRKNTTCPMLHLYGYVFELYRLKNGRPKKRAQFALIPGSEPDRDIDWKRFNRKVGKTRVMPFNHFFHVPCSQDFVEGKVVSASGLTCRSIISEKGVYSKIHAADGTH